MNLSKLALAVAVLAIANIANAGCPETDLSSRAKNLNLEGTVNVHTNGSDEEDTAVVISSGETFEEILKIASSKNQEILSSILGFDSAGEIAAVVRDEGTCEITLLGSDGESIEFSRILDIQANSLKFQLGQRQTTITKK